MAATAKTKSFNFDDLDRGTAFLKMKTAIPPEDLAAIANQLAAKTQQLLTLRDERKEAAHDFGEQIKEVEKEQLGLLGEYQSQTREKEVQCETGYDWKAGKKYVKRLDTGEILEPVDIEEEERQMQIAGMSAIEIVAKKASEGDGETLDVDDEEEAEGDDEEEGIGEDLTSDAFDDDEDGDE